MEIKKEREIAHHNCIAQGRLEEFELRELKLFLILMTDVKKGQLLYKYSHVEIKKFMGMGSQSLIKFSNIIRKLQKRVLVISTKEEETIYNIFTILNFNHKNKIVTVEYSPRFFPLISEFENNFCKYKPKYIEPLTSKYSIIFYTLFKANQFKREFFISIDEINFKLGKKFRVDNLERRVLSPAIEEINKYTDLIIEIEKEYYPINNKLKGYKFIISKKVVKLSSGLKNAVNKAKKNIFISRSKVLNNETIQLLLEEIQEQELINGLNIAYKKINKDFTKLEYLKKVILNNIDYLEYENPKEKKINIKNNDVIDYNNKLIGNFNSIKHINNIETLIIEKETILIDYLITTEKMERGLLNNMKKKSYGIYQNILKNTLKKIEKEF